MLLYTTTKNAIKWCIFSRTCGIVLLCLVAGNSYSTSSTAEDTGFSKAELTLFRYKQGSSDSRRDSESLYSKDQAAPRPLQQHHHTVIKITAKVSGCGRG
jgi:hypothetical protein